MRVAPGVYFGRLDFVCVVIDSNESLSWVKGRVMRKNKFVHDGFEYDPPNGKVTRLSTGEERRITEVDEFGISFEPFKL